MALYFLCQVGPKLVRSGRPTDTDVNTLLSPLCAEPGPGGKCAHSRGRVDEALRARGCTERRGGEVIALYLRRLLLSRLLLRVFTSTSFAPIQRMFSFAFPTLIHVLKRAKKLNESFSF